MSATSGDISQKDLSELLEHFERKSFEAVACDEGTVVSGMADVAAVVVVRVSH